MFSLISEPWLPVLNNAGERKKISPLQLADDAIIELDWPRADFQGAAYQLLIGMLQTACAPQDEEEWQTIWEEGLDPEKLRQGLDAIEPAMQFGKQKPSFLQDFSSLDVENSSIGGLLIDAPGGNALKLNKDHFVKRSCYVRFCPHCTAMALYTVQTNSPAAGAGFRTSMRGGGPITTLVMPQEQRQPLWKKLWLNIIPQGASLDISQYPLVFPWLAPTLSSESASNKVTPDNAHPLQAYWGMPRRLEVDFSTTESGECDLCGELHPGLLTQIRSKNYGVQYEAWLHPLSPYRKPLKDVTSPWLAVKGQSGGLAYKDWLGLMIESEDRFNHIRTAEVVRVHGDRDDVDIKTGLWCFGYDMDNAKARCWYEHRLPISFIPFSTLRLMESVSRQSIELATSSLPLLRQALKEAWFENPKEAKGDFSLIDIAFWQQTERDFRHLWFALMKHPDPVASESRSALRRWISDIEHYLFSAFDRQAFTNPEEVNDLHRILTARKRLDKEFNKQKILNLLRELSTERKEKTDV
ncbi:type I-E CRISPR-associated protein Cse1/CasA [Limnobaculum parvum]|uniref:Type I-E CRISPR-associated protein Cse1/CasA n=1 Tax=Limnobaculum parvum TaxID=2172103 RepID=A0A2Y9TVC9_9GAMM|nr:type I-E CRISPR-associated protein Cse1/CasA [Limnobaculum parvum]AWH87653.1 type I-E CRISPR-associated protein Cse1/CasA [Limnobaculum parvum]